MMRGLTGHGHLIDAGGDRAGGQHVGQDQTPGRGAGSDPSPRVLGCPRARAAAPKNSVISSCGIHVPRGPGRAHIIRTPTSIRARLVGVDLAWRNVDGAGAQRHRVHGNATAARSPEAFSPGHSQSVSVRGGGIARRARRRRHASTNSSTSSGVAGESCAKKARSPGNASRRALVESLRR